MKMLCAISWVEIAPTVLMKHLNTLKVSIQTVKQMDGRQMTGDQKRSLEP